MGQARQRRLNGITPFIALDRELQSFGIDTTEFGFYDHPCFLEQERRNPEFLEKYARWVSLRPRDEAYDAHVRSIVPRITQILASAFRTDSLEGCCKAAASMLVPMLNRLGVWSYGVEGSAIFNLESQNHSRQLYIVDTKDTPDSMLGHAWVIAPPFRIVDASLAFQHWGDDPVARHVPEFLVVENGAEEIEPTLDDIVSHGLRREQMQREGFVDTNLHRRLAPNLSTYRSFAPSLEVSVGELKIRYCPTAIKITDTPLDQIVTDGVHRTAIQIWNDDIAPAFNICE